MSTRIPIAIVGMACRYADARSPHELWENVLAQRRAFRRIPSSRLNYLDYFSSDRTACDSIYSLQAAVIEGYEFDRQRFNISGATFRSVDMAHWLALDIAAAAIEDAGFGNGRDLPRQSTGVLVGNTLTGEFSRANLLRTRWPYVRRIVQRALLSEQWDENRRRKFLTSLEEQFKAPFPPCNEETLAGGLSNTIAGRICNYFDLQGGGYTLDGACASSLLAIAHACMLLQNNELDVALAGGVDLSLDPFELVGFSRTGALAPDEMRVFDAHSQGFWPGEGCGFISLMREDDAIRQGRRIYATIRGWGISSDGAGGITRPEVEGQTLCLRRAYQKAGFGMETVAYFEGHGTGTPVGDETELRALCTARAQCGHRFRAAVGSVKANIGHTKAAAGAAGLIKTVMALHHQTLPPMTGCRQPHELLAHSDSPLRALDRAEPWPEQFPLRMGVSGAGFGGINAHLVLDAQHLSAHRPIDVSRRKYYRSQQDAELFIFGTTTVQELLSRVQSLQQSVQELSFAELSDLAAALAREMESFQVTPHVRAALVASTPLQLAKGLALLIQWLSRPAECAGLRIDIVAGVFLSNGPETSRIGFLFPGQGTLPLPNGGALAERFEIADQIFKNAQLPPHHDALSADFAQAAIVAASAAALRVLDELGISAGVVVGHSLGELSALHYAGCFEEQLLLSLARIRGASFASSCEPGGAMASIAADARRVEEFCGQLTDPNDRAVVAAQNAPMQTVIAGSKKAVAAIVDRAASCGIESVALTVSHAFHSQLVAPVVPVFAKQIQNISFSTPDRTVISTVTGGELSTVDLHEHLCRQITSPVLFRDAITVAMKRADLFIEVGPGHALSSLARECGAGHCVATEAGGDSLRGLLCAIGAAYSAGAPVRVAKLFSDRFTRPFDLGRKPKFFINPCEQLSIIGEQPLAPSQLSYPISEDKTPPSINSSKRDVMGLLRQLVAQRVELPHEAVQPGTHLLRDLHLNSISVAQLVAETCRSLGLAPPAAPTEFANRTVLEIAHAIEQFSELVSREGQSGRDAPKNGDVYRVPPGVDSWVSWFSVDWEQRPLKKDRRPSSAASGAWNVIGPDDFPLTSVIREIMAAQPGNGLILCQPPNADFDQIPLLLKTAQAALSDLRLPVFILVQTGDSVAAIARTIHLENPNLAVRVIHVPPSHPAAAQWVSDEAAAYEPATYQEAKYTPSGQRFEPFWRLIPQTLASARAPLPLTADDVLVVTGGGKGIAYECAQSIAQKTGVRLALLGRSLADPELDANLRRLNAQGIVARYFSADVADPVATHAAISAAQADPDLGPITAVIHAAGINEPQLLSTLDENSFRRTVLTKVAGAKHVFSAVDPNRLKLLVTFGSILARTGFPGEAHYALANEWLTQWTHCWKQNHPQCRCLAIEWSLWSGVGMGQRLGSVDSLTNRGVTAIRLDEGISQFQRLLAASDLPTSVIVTGRFGDLPTARLHQSSLPLRRFLERPLVHYPGIELIVEADLSIGADPYLKDHVFAGECLFPAVLGLEAMAQAACALAGTDELPILTAVRFDRPIVVPEGQRVVIRIAALVRESGVIDVVLRADTTSFASDHFRATCRFGRHTLPALRTLPNAPLTTTGTVAIDLKHDLYGRLLFHGTRFRRLGGYRHLTAKDCWADISPDGDAAWFGSFLPRTCLLGDPGARDATIHALQACVPHATVLPVAVDTIVLGALTSDASYSVSARERSRDGNSFVYDAQILDKSGVPVECWQGLRLQSVGEIAIPDQWPLPLFGAFLERSLDWLFPGAGLTVALHSVSEPFDRRANSDLAIRSALPSQAELYHRSDGRPFVSDRRPFVSAAHAPDLTLAVTSDLPIGCDVEPVVARPRQLWNDLLGSQRVALADLVSAERREDWQQSATRIWCAAECLTKIGAMPSSPLVMDRPGPWGWVLLRSGHFTIATMAASIRGISRPLLFAVGVQKSAEGQPSVLVGAHSAECAS